MDAPDIVETIESFLTNKGYLVKVDPFDKFEELKESEPRKILLIEEEDIPFRHADSGLPHRQNPKIMITAIIPMKDRTFIQARKDSMDLSKEVVSKLIGDGVEPGIDSYKFKLNAKGMTAAELMVGSVKCSTRVTEFEAETPWQDTE